MRTSILAGTWVTFRVTWGGLHGADARRLLAMMCRRGGIQGRDVGTIEVAKTHSFVDIAQSAVPAFEEATRAPDPRDPRVTISPRRRARAECRILPPPPPPKRSRRAESTPAEPSPPAPSVAPRRPSKPWADGAPKRRTKG